MRSDDHTCRHNLFMIQFYYRKSESGRDGDEEVKYMPALERAGEIYAKRMATGFDMHIDRGFKNERVYRTDETKKEYPQI